MNKAQWLEYARNEIRKAEQRTVFEFDDSVSDEERECMADIIAAEEQYISFLRFGIEQMQSPEQRDILEILRSRGKKFSRNN